VTARLALVVPTLFGILLVTFVFVHLVPGDPALARAGDGRGITAESLAAFRHDAGLDRPLAERFARFCARAVRLDFGTSLVDGRPVRARLAEALPSTAALGLLAAALALLLFVPLGALLGAAADVATPFSRGARSLLGAVGAGLVVAWAIPVSAIGLGALALGAPYGRGVGPLVAAAACLALPLGVRLARHQKAALAAALAADFACTARAVGAGPLRVAFRHALPVALLPIVTLVGGELPVLLSGSVLVEQIFGLRGLGALGLDAVAQRDYPTLLGLGAFSALLVLSGTLAADAAYALVDPRLRRREPDR
jgi:ABC-type dipeptide/oligopeptide/nickel transport system permease component